MPAEKRKLLENSDPGIWFTGQFFPGHFDSEINQNAMRGRFARLG